MSRYLLPLLIVMAIVFCNPTKIFGQDQTGCLLNNGNIHYVENGVSGGKVNYKLSPSISSANVFCMETQGVNCRVNAKNNPANQGSLVIFSFVQCPIDDYVLLLISLVGAFAFFKIRSQARNSLVFS
ncbi:MAG TPA: hypothetical protein VL088_08395 [Pedobacter sp.]|nr:hypothetical protein [Pedobacter sp.]